MDWRACAVVVVACAAVGAMLLGGVAAASGGSDGEAIDLFDEASGDAAAGPIRINGRLEGERAEGTSTADAGVEVEGASTPDAGPGVVITRGSVGASGGRTPGNPQKRLTLEFSKRGSAMLVPATINHVEVYMVFDTGASYTTLTPMAALKAEVSPSQDAPEQVATTANGRTKVKFGIIDTLGLDGRSHADVTYGLCEGCQFGVYKGKPVAGLLGLNLLRRYEVTIDSAEGKIQLEASGEFRDRHLDIEPWLAIDEVKGIWPSNRGDRDRTVDFRVRNRSDNYLTDLEFAVTCQGKHLAGTERHQTSLSMGPTATKHASARVPEGACRRPRIQLVGGRW